MSGETAPMLSIVTPAYNEAENLPLMRERLAGALEKLEGGWEWIIVDDHSSDKTFETVSAMAAEDPRVRGVRFSRNFGSHRAILCGLERMKGVCAAVMAGDLQDPPELLPELVAQWREGAKVVWAVRRERKGVGAVSLLCSRLYYLVMRRFVGMKDMPAEGADFLLMDWRVAKSLGRFGESRSSVFALITWMGFPQTRVVYDKEARAHGESGWTLEKKLMLALDSVIAFSYRPIRWISGLGALTALAGVAWAGFILGDSCHCMSRDSGLIASLFLFLTGVTWMMLGVLGEYLWRALDEARRRPRYVIEAETAAKEPE